MTEIYRKLTRKRRRLGGSTQLFLGSDHVLMVRSQRFVEEYRRFQLADIQAIVGSEEAPRWMLRAVFIVCSLLLIAWAAGTQLLAARAVLGVLAVISAGLAAYDFFRGPRCRARLLTEVSAEPLDPITRVSDYARLLASLNPAIESAQGGRFGDAFNDGITGLNPRPAFVRVEEPQGSRYMQHALYGAFLVNAVFCASAYLWRMEQSFGAAISMLFSEFVLTLLLAFRWRYFRVAGVMRVLLGIVTVLIVLDLVSAIGQASYMFYLTAEAGRSGLKTPVFWDVPRIMLLGKISVTWRVIAGITGLLALWLGGSTHAEVGPSAPEQH